MTLLHVPPPDVQSDRLEEARRLYGPGWDSLPEIAQKWAAALLPLQEPDPNQTFDCPRRAKGEHYETPLIVGPENTAWPCDSCEAGTKLDAGIWFSRVYVKRGRKLDVNREQKAACDRYLRDRKNGLAVRERMNVLLDLEERKPVERE